MDEPFKHGIPAHNVSSTELELYHAGLFRQIAESAARTTDHQDSKDQNDPKCNVDFVSLDA
jgi:hypothetical protein